MEIYLPHIFIPMIISNVIHMIIVKKDWFSPLAIPISSPLFGANKTWRGLVILSILNGVLFGGVNAFFPLFEKWESVFFGAILGLAYMLFELPNSWLKRKMGISSGQKTKKNPFLFMLLDKMDSALGVSLASKFIFNLQWIEAVSYTHLTLPTNREV